MAEALMQLKPGSVPAGTSKDAFDTLCYPKPFLNQAILRVDFAVPVTELAKGPPPSLTKIALTHFPIAQPRKTIAQELQIAGNRVTQQRREGTLWTYHGREREKTLTIDGSSLAVVRRRYSTYEEFKEEFFDTLTAFLNAYPDAVIARFGIRYINEIKFKAAASPTDWNGYLNPNLLAMFGFVPDHSVLSRVFNVVELNYGDLQLKYQFGMNNPDYPATIREKSFILDLDAYKAGLQDRAEIVTNVDRAHAKIQELFEASITDKVRKEMK